MTTVYSYSKDNKKAVNVTKQVVAKWEQGAVMSTGYSYSKDNKQAVTTAKKEEGQHT